MNVASCRDRLIALEVPLSFLDFRCHCSADPGRPKQVSVAMARPQRILKQPTANVPESADRLHRVLAMCGPAAVLMRQRHAASPLRDSAACRSHAYPIDRPSPLLALPIRGPPWLAAMAAGSQLSRGSGAGSVATRAMPGAHRGPQSGTESLVAQGPHEAPHGATWDRDEAAEGRTAAAACSTFISCPPPERPATRPASFDRPAAAMPLLTPPPALPRCGSHPAVPASTRCPLVCR